MKNRIKFERRTDVVISIILIMTFVISFFVSEQNNKLFFNVLFIVVGIIGAIYLIHSASLLLIKRIEFDWILVKGNFLHKVFNIVLIVPIVLTVIFILSELRLQNKDAGKDVFVLCCGRGIAPYRLGKPCALFYKTGLRRFFQVWYGHRRCIVCDRSAFALQRQGDNRGNRYHNRRSCAYRQHYEASDGA